MSVSKFVRVVNGHAVPDKEFDESLIPTTGQNAGIINSKYTISATNPVITELSQDELQRKILYGMYQ